VQIGLKRENNGTNDYSVATFKLLQDFQGELFFGNGTSHNIVFSSLNKKRGIPPVC